MPFGVLDGRDEGAIHVHALLGVEFEGMSMVEFIRDWDFVGCWGEEFVLGVDFHTWDNTLNISYKTKATQNQIITHRNLTCAEN